MTSIFTLWMILVTVSECFLMPFLSSLGFWGNVAGFIVTLGSVLSRNATLCCVLNSPCVRAYFNLFAGLSTINRFFQVFCCLQNNLSLSDIVQGLTVTLAHSGNFPMSNMAYPQVLMPKLVVKIPMMFSMKPAFTWRDRKSHEQHVYIYEATIQPEKSQVISRSLLNTVF